MNESALEVRASVAGGSVRRADSTVEVTLTNASPDPVAVCARLAIGYPDLRPRELVIEVRRSSDGTPAGEPSRRYEREHPTATDVVWLDPAESLATRFQLLDWFRLPGPGDYDVTVAYESPDPLWTGVDALLEGRFEAPPVRVHYVE